MNSFEVVSTGDARATMVQVLLSRLQRSLKSWAWGPSSSRQLRRLSFSSRRG